MEVGLGVSCVSYVNFLARGMSGMRIFLAGEAHE